MSRIDTLKLWLKNEPCTQFYYVDSKDKKMREFTDPFFTEDEMIEWYSKWAEYWEAKGYQLFLVEHKRHPKKLET